MSRPPEHPDGPSDSWADNPPPGYETPPGYGAPTPPPGYPPTPGQPFSIGDALSWAFNKFGKNAGPLILSTLIYGVLGIILEMLLMTVLGGLNSHPTSTEAANGPAFATGFGVTGTLVLQIVAPFIVVVVLAGYLSGELDIADDRPVTVGTFFQPRNFGIVLQWAALLVVISLILNSPSLLGGWVFLLVTFAVGLIFGFFALYGPAFVIDRGLPAFGALKASFSMVSSHIGAALLSYVLQYLVLVIGALLCGIGLIVALPVAVLIQVYTYRRLTGGVIAPLTA